MSSSRAAAIAATAGRIGSLRPRPFAWANVGSDNPTVRNISFPTRFPGRTSVANLKFKP